MKFPLSQVRPSIAGALALALLSLLTTVGQAFEDEPGFKPLFNGVDLSGWDGSPKFWSVEDGCIVGRTTKDNPTSGNTFLIWRDGLVDDFELRLSFQIIGGNSGIQYRSAELDHWVVGGYQGDFEAGDTYSGILYEERGRGILAERGKKVTIGADGQKIVTGELGASPDLQAAIKKEQWNDYVITAKGNRLVHVINGKVMVDVTDEEEAKRAMSGILALQLHAGPPMTVRFKNVRLKRTRLENRKKIVLVAGRPSHGPGDHEFNAGTMILKRCLNEQPGILAVSYHNGWPNDPSAFDNADSILFYMDGGGGHPLIATEHLKRIGELMDQGIGLCLCHYAVEVPKEQGGPELLNWIGGYYEAGFSINPHWDADFAKLPQHEVTRGVHPFKIRDEWYYNIRFRSGAVEPLLVSTPPDETRGTPAAKERKGQAEIVAWTMVRPGGGRGFGFTGGHVHKNWGNDDFRKLVLNALMWTAGATVPEDGATSKVEEDELGKNLDKK